MGTWAEEEAWGRQEPLDRGDVWCKAQNCARYMESQVCNLPFLHYFVPPHFPSPPVSQVRIALVTQSIRRVHAEHIQACAKSHSHG